MVAGVLVPRFKEDVSKVDTGVVDLDTTTCDSGFSISGSNTLKEPLIPMIDLSQSHN